MNFFFNFIKITFIIFLTSCSETRLATHITKQVLKDTGASDTKLKSDSGQKPIYKVGDPYFVNGIKYIPKEDNSYYEVGIASWYGPNFHGKLTANGEIFNQYDITAAHKTLPLPSIVKVINLENKREIILRINDRGPFVVDRIIDLSLKSAQLLGIKNKGTAKVSVELLEYGKHLLEKNKTFNHKVEKYKIFYIQVGAFSKPGNADKFAEKLRTEKFVQSDVSIKTIYKNEQILYIVRIGPLDNDEEASYVKRTLERNNINSQIIQEPTS